MKAEVGKNTRRYPHKFKFGNYTTSSFGFVQPLFHQYMDNGDRLKLSSGQLVRLAPMPVPTLGNMQVINKFRFVEMNELYPYYDAFLAKRSVRSSSGQFIPTKLPFTTNNALWSLVLFGSVRYQTESHPTLGAVTCFKQWKNHPATLQTDVTEVEMSNGLAGALNYFTPSNDQIHPISDERECYNLQLTSVYNASNCDFAIYNTGTFNSVTEPEFPNIFFITLNNAGRRIFNILRGVGFSMDPTDCTELDILPIFAFIKAYFDEYVPQRSINWHSTDAYNFLVKISQDNFIDFSNYNNDSDHVDLDEIQLKSLFHDILYDLRNCFYTYENDWVSAHTSLALNSTPDEDVSYVSSDGTSLGTVTGGSNIPRFLSLTANSLTQYGLDALRMLTRRQAKESLIGGKIYEYIKNKYGSGVADDMFAESHNVGSFISDCSISDVLSSADTSSGNNGERLGAYAGLGIGRGKSKISFRANNFGYFIGMMAVVPESHFYQGNDPSLTALTREDMPNSDYDALGYELTPRSSVFDNNGYGIELTQGDKLTRGFGFLPRLSKWKVKKDIVNGCMRFRSVSRSFDPYHLDRIITRYKVTGYANINYDGSAVPDASTAWRYIGKYPQLGNYNRIFYNAGEATQLSIVDDNFIIDTKFTLTLTNCLRPITKSFQAYDEEIDNASNSVSVQ